MLSVLEHPNYGTPLPPDIPMMTCRGAPVTWKRITADILCKFLLSPVSGKERQPYQVTAYQLRAGKGPDGKLPGHTYIGKQIFTASLFGNLRGPLMYRPSNIVSLQMPL